MKNIFHPKKHRVHTEEEDKSGIIMQINRFHSIVFVTPCSVFGNPDAVAFPVLANEQTFFLKSLGYALHCSFGFPDSLGHHFLRGVRIFCQALQNCQFVQSAIIAL